MIDKISGNDSYDFHGSNSTKKRKNPAVRAYENTPGTGESERKRAERIRREGGLAQEKESGVILDLSSRSAEKKKAAGDAGQKKESSWADALRRLINPVVRWLKDFWESDKAPDLGKTETSDADNAEETLDSGLQPLDEISETGEQKTAADEAVKSGSLQQIEQFVTQNGTKRLAHNSDLLTYYDRRGKFVEMDETEKHRVLFGDKHVLKL